MNGGLRLTSLLQRIIMETSTTSWTQLTMRPLNLKPMIKLQHNNRTVVMLRLRREEGWSLSQLRAAAMASKYLDPLT
jgi:hypothetical protein